MFGVLLHALSRPPAVCGRYGIAYFLDLLADWLRNRLSRTRDDINSVGVFCDCCALMIMLFPLLKRRGRSVSNDFEYC